MFGSKEKILLGLMILIRRRIDHERLEKYITMTAQEVLLEHTWQKSTRFLNSTKTLHLSSKIAKNTEPAS